MKHGNNPILLTQVMLKWMAFAKASYAINGNNWWVMNRFAVVMGSWRMAFVNTSYATTNIFSPWRSYPDPSVHTVLLAAASPLRSAGLLAISQCISVIFFLNLVTFFCFTKCQRERQKHRRFHLTQNRRFLASGGIFWCETVGYILWYRFHRHLIATIRTCIYRAASFPLLKFMSFYISIT